LVQKDNFKKISVQILLATRLLINKNVLKLRFLDSVVVAVQQVPNHGCMNRRLGGERRDVAPGWRR
jgi:hypothetical protein